MDRFLPHALIALSIVLFGWLGDLALLLFVAGHVLAPIWAARHAAPGHGTRAFVVGPGLVIGAHAVVVALLFLIMIGGNPEDTWLNLMLLAFWAAAVAGYAIYCVIAFAIAARTRR